MRRRLWPALAVNYVNATTPYGSQRKSSTTAWRTSAVRVLPRPPRSAAKP